MRISILFAMTCLATALHAQSGCNDPPASAVSTVSLPQRPFSMALSADGCWVFVSLVNTEKGTTQSVAVLSHRNGRVDLVRTVPLPSRPAGLVLTHDGKLLIAAALDKVLFLDVVCLIAGCPKPVAGSFSDGKSTQSVYANVTSDDKWLFISEETAYQITVIDLVRARQSGFHADAIVGKIPVGKSPIALTFSPDEKWLYTTSQGAAKEWGWPAACKAENRPKTPGLVNPEGAVVTIDVVRATSDPAHAVVSRVPAGCSPVRLALSPSGDRVYVTARNSDAVLAFAADKLISDPEHARLGQTAVGTAPVPIAVIHDGKTVVSGNSDRFGGADAAQILTLLDASKIGSPDAIMGAIPAGAFPRDLRVSPDGSILYLTNFGSNSLQVMDVARLKSSR